MLQNCGAGRNGCPERRSLAALQRHPEGNVSAVLITFAVYGLKPPTTHTVVGVLEERISRTSDMTLYNSSNKTWICANPVERIVVAERLL
jgi:hypothetical protein